MIDVFQIFRLLVPEFKDEILFRGFLIAFGHHVRLTLQRDFDYGLVTHWWNGQIKCSDCMFLDSSRGGGREVFNEEGRLRLALYLAEQTFVSLEQYFTSDVHAQFLESSAVLVERDYLKKHLEEIPKGSLEEGLLTVPKLAPKFALPKALVKAQMKDKVSKSKLSKRKPNLTDEEVKEMERKRKNKADSRARQAQKAGNLHLFREKVSLKRP